MDLDAYHTPQAESLLRSAQTRPVIGQGPPRAQITETSSAVAFLTLAILLATQTTWNRPLSAPALGFSVLAYLTARQIRFPVGSAWTMPTQLIFVPMLFILPTPLVPLIVAGCSLLDLWPAAVARRLSTTVVAGRLGDCFYSLAPALVLVLAGERAFSWTHWPVLLLAFAVQFPCDAASGLTRTWFAERIRPSTQPQMLWLYFTDAGLSCAALLITGAIIGRPGLILLTMPLFAVLSVFASERQRRLQGTLELSTAYRGAAVLLGDVIAAVDHYTGVHTRQVVELSVAVTQLMDLDATHRRDVEYAAMLHDVGKIHVPIAILNKPGSLDEAEWQIMRRHTIEGEAMLTQIGGVLANVGRFVRSSHERYDGAGYPDGLAGDSIPIEARIVCACDAYNAMTTDRPYRARRPTIDALTELHHCAGRQFDPSVVDALTAICNGIQPAGA